MLLKLKKIFTTDLVKVSFLSGISTLIRVITAFVSVKIVAKHLEPAGMALLGQLNNFSLIVLSISSGGINNGITKYVAQYADSPSRYRVLLSTAFRITATVSLFSGLVMILGAGYWARIILKDVNYISVFYIFGTTIILYTLNALLVSAINGFKEFRKYVTVNIISSLAGLLFAIVLTLTLGVFGALVALITYQSVVFVITLAMVSRSSWFSWKIFFGTFDKQEAIKLGHYAVMALVSAITVPLSQLVVRNHITSHLDLNQAGLWESMNRISAMYLMVVTTSLSVYYLPKLSGLKTDREVRNEVFSVYKMLIPFLIFVSGTIYMMRSYVIPILFDAKFHGMENLFAFQMIGDVLKMTTWVLGYILVAKAMTKTYVVVEIVATSLFATLSILFVNIFGTIGATIGYAAAFFCQLLIMIFIFRKLLFSKHG